MTVLLHPFAAAAQPSLPGVRVDADAARLLRRTLVDHDAGVLGVASVFLSWMVPASDDADAARLADAMERVAGVLEDPAQTRRRLRDLADVLGSFGVSPRDCARAKQAFLSAVRGALGERWSADVEREWLVALDLLARMRPRTRAQA